MLQGRVECERAWKRGEEGKVFLSRGHPSSDLEGASHADLWGQCGQKQQCLSRPRDKKLQQEGVDGADGVGGSWR